MRPSRTQDAGAGSLRAVLGVVLAGILLGVLLEVIARLLPPHYSPLNQSESDLAVGPYGFVEAIAFLIRGFLILVFLAAFVRIIPKPAQSRTGLILLGASGIGKLIIAFVPTDLTPRPHTIPGALHALVALTSFFCFALGALLLARALRHDPHLRASQGLLVGLASVTLVWSVIVIVTVTVSAQIGIWGLLERILTALSLLWTLLVSLELWQHPVADLTAGVTI